MNKQLSEIPAWFTWVVTIGLVWNLLGLMSFVAHLMTTPESLAATMPEPEAALYLNYPLWATYSFGIAVITGTLGCVLLLLKQGWAFWLFLISLVAMLIQNYHAFILVDSYRVFGAGSLTVPILVLVVGLYLMWLSHRGNRQGWLK